MIVVVVDRFRTGNSSISSNDRSIGGASLFDANFSTNRSHEGRINGRSILVGEELYLVVVPASARGAFLVQFHGYHRLVVVILLTMVAVNT
jgi:hypothetical protein